MSIQGAIHTEGVEDSQVLRDAQLARAQVQSGELAMALAGLAWCRTHPVVDEDEAAVVFLPDGPEPVAGVGAPLVSSTAVAEFAAVVGLSTPAGRSYLGDILELAYRLPRLWEAVTCGVVAVWRARRVAEHTRSLNQLAVAYVDADLAATGHRQLGQARVERLVGAAMARELVKLFV